MVNSSSSWPHTDLHEDYGQRGRGLAPQRAPRRKHRGEEAVVLVRRAVVRVVLACGQTGRTGRALGESASLRRSAMGLVEE